MLCTGLHSLSASGVQEGTVGARENCVAARSLFLGKRAVVTGIFMSLLPGRKQLTGKQTLLESCLRFGLTSPALLRRGCHETDNKEHKQRRTMSHGSSSIQEAEPPWAGRCYLGDAWNALEFQVFLSSKSHSPTCMAKEKECL